MKEGMLTDYYCACAGEILDSVVLSTLHFVRSRELKGPSGSLGTLLRYANLPSSHVLSTKI